MKVNPPAMGVSDVGVATFASGTTETVALGLHHPEVSVH